MPPTFTDANLTGLESCRSLAKGIEDKASNAMTAAASERYSGCWVIRNSIAIGCCNPISKKDNSTVEKIREMLVVL